MIISGTDSGTIADAMGNFSIEINKNDILIVSYVGYESKYITIDNTKHLNISLEMKMDILDEVIITGYSSRIYSSPTICLAPPTRRTNVQSIVRPITTNHSNMVFPNPTSTGYITINMPKQYTTLELSVHSITGQRLIHQTFNQPKERLSVDLSRFSTGIYLINMVADGEPLPAQKVIRS